MSDLAFDWAWEQDIRPATTKLVLLVLADWSDAEGMVYLDYNWIGKDSGIDSGEVKEHIDKLEKLGYISSRNCSEKYRRLTLPQHLI